MKYEKYLKAFENRDIHILKELAQSARYKKQDLSSLDGFCEAYEKADNLEKKFIKTKNGELAHGFYDYAPINFLDIFHKGYFGLNKTHLVAIGITDKGSSTRCDKERYWMGADHYFEEYNRTVVYRRRIGKIMNNPEKLYKDLLMFDANKYIRLSNKVHIGLITTAIITIPIALTNDPLVFLFAPPLFALTYIESHRFFSYDETAIKQIVREAK